jgi:L-malate glycosyltransferase
MDFTNNEYWTQGYKNTVFQKTSKGDQIRQLIEKFVKKGNGSAVEIGCFPGRYLAVFGDLGYELHGVDLIPETSTLLKSWLEEQKYKVGDLEVKDFSLLNPSEKKYDVVSSFGFIEHFENYEEIIQTHCDLVEESGHLVITAPNYLGHTQNFLHRKLDLVNLNRHNVNSMIPENWANIARDNDFEILYAGYFGYFYFWAENDDQNAFQKLFIQMIRKTLPVSSRILPNNTKSFSPFCGLIAKRK